MITYHLHMRSTAGELVRLARTNRALTQRELARRSGVAQPNIAAVESTDGKDATVGTVERLVTAAGSRITVLPSSEPTVAAVGAQIAELLAASKTRQAYRVWLGLHDGLVRAEPALRVALAVTPPPPTASREWDALLAAVVDHDLAGLPVPRWVQEPDRVAGGWFVDDAPSLRSRIKRRTPPAFRRHGVWIDASELRSI